MLDILYEDEAFVFINKPAGIVVQQRMHEPDEPFLHDLVMRHTSPAYLMQRLDRGTSGVIFFSKRGDLNVRFTRQFERKRIRKRYLALCDGELREKQTVDAPIGRIGAIKFGVRDDGKRAVTHIAPLAAQRSGSLLSIDLETGRTHQIRVHLAHAGWPVVGDPVYGGRVKKLLSLDESERSLPRALLQCLPRQALHAVQLKLKHSASGRVLEFESAWPHDFGAAVELLRAFRSR